jgi:hypothetical protein
MIAKTSCNNVQRATCFAFLSDESIYILAPTYICLRYLKMFKKHALALTLSFATCGAAIAADNLLPTQPDLGQVEFVGTIIDSPCSITPDTADQTVPMGLVSSAVLAEGNTKVIPFNIELEGCTAEAAKKVSVKFTGNSAETGGNALAIEGTAAGAGAGIELTVWRWYSPDSCPQKGVVIRLQTG